jgi:FtsP/CotA-like multicopper oxidase with cupredoxin domain
MSSAALDLITAIAAVLSLIGAAGSQPPALPREAIVSNDNLVSAGTTVKRVFYLSLEARWGMWYPDGPGREGVPMQAFAETGKPLQIPSPLIRVPLGTEIVLRLRNSIPATTLTVHGLVDRPTHQDRPFSIVSGSVRTVRFRAGAEGTYAYWASTRAREPVTNHLGWDSQLGGAFVVDPVRPRHSFRIDRIFVIATWLNVFDAAGNRKPWYAIDTINGRAWPYTERLSYRQGDVVHWRWINIGAVAHPMHLHGFYFRVDSRGDGIGENAYRSLAERDVAATELIYPGGTFSMTWTASRPGHWLFHCHIPAHTVAHLPLNDMLSGHAPVTTVEQYVNDYVPHAGMGNLILGIGVRPAPTWHVPVFRPARHLVLLVEPRAENAPGEPAFRYVIQEGAARLEEAGSIGPPLILTQGEPVAIEIKNELTEPTNVHWHGIELQDSYYDGVGGFSGGEGRTAPMIMPGSSFGVAFTPPRAGTFAYHTHLHDQWQFRGGLAGPLIVLPRGQQFDAQRDHIVMLTSPNAAKDLLSMTLINGQEQPQPIAVRAGVSHRFRLINLTVANALTIVSLESGAGPVLWRPLALDGADLPAARRTLQRAVQVLTIGQTRDFEFTPTAGGELSFVMRLRANGRIAGRLAVHVI